MNIKLFLLSLPRHPLVYLPLIGKYSQVDVSDIEVASEDVKIVEEGI